MNNIKFTQVGDPENFAFDNIYMIDGKEVTKREHIEKGLELSLVHGKALVHNRYCNKRMKLIQDLITNPYKEN